MRDLCAIWIGDGYLAAVGPDEADLEMLARIQLCPDGEEWESGWLVNVPDDLADELERQGCSDQYFSDGYEAANAAAPYVSQS